MGQTFGDEIPGLMLRPWWMVWTRSLRLLYFGTVPGDGWASSSVFRHFTSLPRKHNRRDYHHHFSRNMFRSQEDIDTHFRETLATVRRKLSPDIAKPVPEGGPLRTAALRSGRCLNSSPKRAKVPQTPPSRLGGSALSSIKI